MLIDAIIKGDLELVKNMKKYWDESACCDAILYDKMDILKHLHDNGCPWDINAYYDAAKYGSDPRALQYFRYLHDNKCPLDRSVYYQCIMHGGRDAIEFINKMGHPPMKEDYQNAIKFGLTDIAKRIKKMIREP
jgi:hypothetical protein